MAFIVVLNDGETFSASTGVRVYEVVDELDTEGIEEALKERAQGRNPEWLKPSGTFVEGFLHRADTAGAVFVADDIRIEWDIWVDERPDLPDFDKVVDDLMSTWEWRKDIGDILTERGWDIISSMVTDFIEDNYPST